MISIPSLQHLQIHIKPKPGFHAWFDFFSSMKAKAFYPLFFFKVIDN